MRYKSLPDKRRARFAALIIAAGLTAAPVHSQTAAPAASQDGASSNAAPELSVSGDQQAQTVTIFGKAREKGDPTITQIPTHDADSCGFLNNYDPANEEIVQDYLKSFYGDYTSTIGGGVNGDSSGADQNGVRFKDNSPFGNVSEDNAADHNTLPGMQINGTDANGAPTDNTGAGGGCLPSDKAFAAGRSYIARTDHSLKDAFAAFDAKDYPKALDLFQKSYVKMGYDSAALMEGKMYLAGMGTRPDAQQAVIWLKKVVEARFAPGDVLAFNPNDPTYMNTRIDAAMTLAKIYMVGMGGVTRDANEARHWYMKADDFGYMPATYTVGQIYELGYAGEKNLPKAVSYFKKAGTAGYAPAMYELGEIYRDGADGVAADPKTGAQWLLEAAKRGHPDALYAVGNMYDLGETLPHDPQKAVVYYKEAALKGQADAEDAIGLMFYTGDVLGKDQDAARKWFYQAALQRQPDAMFNLGAMYANGQGGDKDLVKAYVWLKLAQAEGAEGAGAALTAVAAHMSADERAKGDALLQPSKTG
jgi:TPR repeat protein